MALIAIDARFLHIGLSREKPFKGAIGGIGGVQLNQTQRLPRRGTVKYLMLGDGTYPLNDLSSAIGQRDDITYMRMPQALYKLRHLPESIARILERVQYADYFRRIRKYEAVLVHTHGDLWHIPVSGSPPFKTLVTLHDHLFCANNQNYRRPLSEIEKEIEAISYLTKLRKSTHIVAVSNGIRNQLIEDFGFSESQVTTVYNGVDRDRFVRVIPNDENYRKLAARLGITKPFFIYAGSWHPKKNVQGIIASFEYYRERYGEDVQLVLAGNIPKYAPEMTRQIHNRIEQSPYAPDILAIGFMSAEEISLLNSNAEAFIHLSYYEGHCLGIAEAMSCGAPLVVSNGGAIDEEVGPNVPQFNPDDPRVVAEEIQRLRKNSDYRKARIVAQDRAVEQFTWAKSAEDLLSVYEKLITG